MYLIVAVVIAIIVIKCLRKNQYRKLEAEILNELGILCWTAINYIDEYITVKSRQSLERYDIVNYFKEDNNRLSQAEDIIEWKYKISTKTRSFLKDNEYKYPSAVQESCKED